MAAREINIHVCLYRIVHTYAHIGAVLYSEPKITARTISQVGITNQN